MASRWASCWYAFIPRTPFPSKDFAIQGPPIGGVLFSLDASNILPFCVLSTLALVDIVMCLLLDPAVKEIAPLFAPAHGRHTSTIYDEDASAAEDPSTHTDQIAKELMKERAEHRLSSRIWRVLTDIHVLVIFGCVVSLPSNKVNNFLMRNEKRFFCRPFP